MKDRKIWEKVRTHVKDLFSPQGEILWEHISEYYTLDPSAKTTDASIIKESIKRQVKNPKHHDLFNRFIDGINAAEPTSGPNIAKEILAQRASVVGGELAQQILAGTRVDRKLITAYEQLVDQQELDGTDEDSHRSFTGATVESLKDADDGASRLPLYPNSLNTRIGGGCLAGDHVLIFARPEVGKTASALNFIRGLAKSDKRVIYFGNEDPVRRVMQRAKACFSELTFEECLNDPERADELSSKNGFGNVTFCEFYPGSVGQIREIVEANKPDAILIDQLPNLEGGKTENYTLHLGTLARGVRAVAKKYNCLAISYCQAGDSAENKLILEMGDVSWSNTDVQATADLMIGIGMDREYAQRGWRMLSICKNKLTGNHDYFPVQLDPQLSRLRSLE